MAEEERTAEAAPIPAADAAGGLARADSPFENLELRGGAKVNGETNGHAMDGGSLDLVLDIPLRLSVELGRTELPIREVMRLGRGSMVELDRGPGAPLDVRVNGILIGRGEVVVVNEERLGLRFVEVVSPLERAKRLR
jgi:flagellar motor switch protein FliN